VVYEYSFLDGSVLGLLLDRFEEFYGGEGGVPLIQVRSNYMLQHIRQTQTISRIPDPGSTVIDLCYINCRSPLFIIVKWR
jgi:hypothetical protein